MVTYLRKYVARGTDGPFGVTWGVYRQGEGDPAAGLLLASVVGHPGKGIEPEAMAKRLALLLEVDEKQAQDWDLAHAAQRGRETPEAMAKRLALLLEVDEKQAQDWDLAHAAQRSRETPEE
jgi:hypothetical protein